MTWWHLLRSITNLVIPCLACERLRFFECAPETSSVTGTIICPKNDKVRLCIQEDPTSLPSLLLDLPLPMSEFASQIRCGMTRIVLECVLDSSDSRGPLLSVPTWVTYFNGRRVGFATKCEVTEKVKWLLETKRTVSTGAGILPEKASDSEWCKYLRGTFERVVGSTNSEAYHLIDRSGCLGQELSIFFLR